MSVRDLAQTIKNAVDKRIANETCAKRGMIQNGMFQSGSKSYPYKQAVDCRAREGNKVWAQLSKNGTAVIVGA